MLLYSSRLFYSSFFLFQCSFSLLQVFLQSRSNKDTSFFFLAAFTSRVEVCLFQSYLTLNSLIFLTVNVHHVHHFFSLIHREVNLRWFYAWTLKFTEQMWRSELLQTEMNSVLVCYNWKRYSLLFKKNTVNETVFVYPTIFYCSKHICCSDFGKIDQNYPFWKLSFLLILFLFLFLFCLFVLFLFIICWLDKCIFMLYLFMGCDNIIIFAERFAGFGFKKWCSKFLLLRFPTAV